MTPPELHIASLVVHATPRRASGVAASIGAVSGALVHAASAHGKLVVTLEAGSAGELTQQVDRMRCLHGVLSVALVYQCADSLDAMNKEIADA